MPTEAGKSIFVRSCIIPGFTNQTFRDSVYYMKQTTILPGQLRRHILDQSKRANVGHIGSALSIVEIISVLYSRILRIPNPKDLTRDRFILSKGHAALTQYSAFYLMGWLSQETLNTYCGNGTLLGVHPDNALEGVDFSTGSLGHGLAYGAGSALAARLENSPRNVYVLISDAECNEGSLWETVMFAAHHQLSNLIAIVDENKQQALGHTKDILSLHPLADRWRAFGWDAVEADGHDTNELTRIITAFDKSSAPPHVLIAHTTFGKGVSFMEGRLEWHYLPMSDDQHRQALEDLGEGP